MTPDPCSVCGRAKCAALGTHNPKDPRTRTEAWCNHWRLGYERTRTALAAAQGALRELLKAMKDPGPECAWLAIAQRNSDAALTTSGKPGGEALGACGMEEKPHEFDQDKCVGWKPAPAPPEGHPAPEGDE